MVGSVKVLAFGIASADKVGRSVDHLLNVKLEELRPSLKQLSMPQLTTLVANIKNGQWPGIPDAVLRLSGLMDE